MRVAVISTSRIPSRTANSMQVMKVCNALSALKHEVCLWLPGSRSKVEWQQLCTLYGIDNEFEIRWLRSIGFFRRYDFAFRAIVEARKWDADLYYIWPLQAAALASFMGLPTALEMHDKPQGRFGPHLFRWFLRGRGAIRLLPITDALRNYLSREYNRDLSEPFAVVSPMGVDLDRYEDLPTPAQARTELNLTEGFTVGYTGHLYPGRGLTLLWELAVRNPEMQFLWVGGEPDAVQHWQRRSVDEGISNVHIQGFVENEVLPLYQAACDVLAMPYEQEVSVSSGGDTAAFASPMKTFEYLAAGRVILSSDLPVLLEVLNASNAVILPVHDVTAWHDSINRIADEPSLRLSLMRQAKSDALSYSWTHRAMKSLKGIS